MLSSKRYKSNSYNLINGVYYDNELNDVNPVLSEVLKDHNVKFVSVTEPRGIFDRSWEMSVALTAARRTPTFATGVLISYENKKMRFGPIHGLDKKVKTFNGLILEHV